MLLLIPSGSVRRANPTWPGETISITESNLFQITITLIGNAAVVKIRRQKKHCRMNVARAAYKGRSRSSLSYL
jgi:hypothetical protein